LADRFRGPDDSERVFDQNPLVGGELIKEKCVVGSNIWKESEPTPSRATNPVKSTTVHAL
jgi:hypothetical protein